MRALALNADIKDGEWFLISLSALRLSVDCIYGSLLPLFLAIFPFSFHIGGEVEPIMV